jgi:hypothetical protein
MSIAPGYASNLFLLIDYNEFKELLNLLPPILDNEAIL